MAIADQKKTLTDSVSQLRLAEQQLVQASRATTDPAALMKINTEYSQLDSFISQMLHAQATADDADFANAVAALKQQSATLQVQEDDIKAIVSDVGTAAKVAGYVAQALAFIATL